MLTEITNPDEVFKTAAGSDSIFTLPIEKDDHSRIGISIGGGRGANCPSLYVVQIFDNSSASKNQRIEIGDEIIGVNGKSVKTEDKYEVAEKIRQTSGPVLLTIKKLHFDPDDSQFFDFDILIKKFKHRFVDSVDEKLADALGISRAVLVNDEVKNLQDRLESNKVFYKSLKGKMERILDCYREQIYCMNGLCCSFCEMNQYTNFTSDIHSSDDGFIYCVGKCHKSLAKALTSFLQKASKIMEELEVYLCKTIPDALATMNKYLDTKYEYLSFCLKAKEMEDEEIQMFTSGDFLLRMEDGNLEYRLTLKLREICKYKFAMMKNQLAMKVELLDEKRARELGVIFQSLLTDMRKMQQDGLANSHKI